MGPAPEKTHQTNRVQKRRSGPGYHVIFYDFIKSLVTLIYRLLKGDLSNKGNGFRRLNESRQARYFPEQSNNMRFFPKLRQEERINTFVSITFR